MTAGIKIQALRKSKGMTQEELAAKLSVSRQAVSRWELDNALPDTENLIRLSKIFGVSMDYLVNDTVEYETELPLAQNIKKKTEQKNRIKFIVLAVYLSSVLIFFIVTKSVGVSIVYLSLGFWAYLFYLVIRFLRTAIRKK